MVLELLVRLYKIPGEIFSMLESRAVFLNMGQARPLFGFIFAELFTN